MGLATGALVFEHAFMPWMIYATSEEGQPEGHAQALAYTLNTVGAFTALSVGLSAGYTGPPPMAVATFMIDSAYVGLTIGTLTQNTDIAQRFARTDLAQTIRDLPF
ncbi:MAG: hypothetical protein [Circoviridae sp.]|nr:MAG: hypothetical protein [Circoviridae sp.]